jgi:lysozyme
MSERRLPDVYDGPFVIGIDVSHHQRDITWEDIPDSIRFAFIRIGDGLTLDRKFHYNWQNSSHIPFRGIYHYFRGRHSAEAQFRFIQDNVERYSLLTDERFLGFSVDLETLDGEAVPEFVFQVSQMVKLLTQWSRRRAIIYSGQFWHWKIAVPYPEYSNIFSGYPLWLPDYSHPPNLPNGWNRWTFLQYTNSGQVSGIQTDVDLNKFRGDENALAKFSRECKKAPSFTRLIVPISLFAIPFFLMSMSK